MALVRASMDSMHQPHSPWELPRGRWRCPGCNPCVAQRRDPSSASEEWGVDSLTLGAPQRKNNAKTTRKKSGIVILGTIPFWAEWCLGYSCCRCNQPQLCREFTRIMDWTMPKQPPKKTLNLIYIVFLGGVHLQSPRQPANCSSAPFFVAGHLIWWNGPPTCLHRFQTVSNDPWLIKWHHTLHCECKQHGIENPVSSVKAILQDLLS